MKNFKTKAALTSVILVASGYAATANAALSSEVTTGFTGLKTDALALIDLAWPVVVAVTVGFIMLGLFKKAAGKAV